MNTLLILRDTFRAVYARYGAFLRPVLKLLLAFVMLVVIEKNIGYYELLSRPAVILAASAVCALFPWGFISAAAAAFIIGNMFEVSMLMAAVTAAFCIVVFVLYYGYKPGTGIIISLVPLMFYFKLPFLIPVILGLSVGISSAVPAAIGVAAWQLIHYFAVNVKTIQESGYSMASSEMTAVIRQLFSSRYMLLTMLAFVICIAAVSIISESSIDNCRVLAVSAGTGILAVLMIVGGVILGADISILTDIIGLVVSYILELLYVTVFFSADYSRIEKMSYEDDDYYYYVKAVPKIKPYGRR